MNKFQFYYSEQKQEGDKNQRWVVSDSTDFIDPRFEASLIMLQFIIYSLNC